jgi:RNA recognition motif-containing protein
VMDRDTGKSKGFGFVTMGTEKEAQAVITALNGKPLDGRSLTVNIAKPREERGGGGGRGPLLICILIPLGVYATSPGLILSQPPLSSINGRAP